jgi:hypothetical protein
MHLIAIEPRSAGLMLPPSTFFARSTSATLLPRVATDDGVFAERSPSATRRPLSAQTVSLGEPRLSCVATRMRISSWCIPTACVSASHGEICRANAAAGRG